MRSSGLSGDRGRSQISLISPAHEISCFVITAARGAHPDSSGGNHGSLWPNFLSFYLWGKENHRNLKTNPQQMAELSIEMLEVETGSLDLFALRSRRVLPRRPQRYEKGK